MNVTRLKSAIPLAAALLLAPFAATMAQDRNGSILQELRHIPASAYDVGVLKIERSLTDIEQALWSFTYDLSDYGDEEDSYAFKYPYINYRYAYPQFIRESGQLLLIGVVVAQGKYLTPDYCGVVLREMADALTAQTGSPGSRDARARAYLEHVFPYSEPFTDDDTSELTTRLLDDVLVEVRLYEDLPRAEPDAGCRGGLNETPEAYRSLSG